jgi:ATP-binding cassette subfamily G (WHITE) protein 2
MSALKELAGTQRTIVTVIHQPRSSIFAMLDRLVLLSEGRTIYVGPAADAPLYFHRQGFTCPAHSSPADYLLDVVAKDFRTCRLEALSQQRIDVLTQAYEEHCRTEQALVPAPGDGKRKELVVSSMTEGRSMVSDDGASYGAGWCTQVRFLAWRNVMVASRNKIGRIVGLALPVLFGLLIGSIWSNRDTDPQQAIQDRIGLMFMATILMGFMGMSETLQTFPIEKRTVQKERASGFYSLSAYYAAKVVTNVPFAVAGPMLFCCIVYPAADMRAGFEHFLVWLAVIVAQVVAAGSLGMFLSSIASDPEIANAMAPAFNIIFTVFNGK